MKKKTLLLCLSLIAVLCTALAFASFMTAAEAVVYVNQSTGADTNSGTDPSAPLASIDAAVAKLSGGGKLVLTGNYDIASSYTFPSHKNEIVITRKDGDVVYDAKLTFGSSVFLHLSGPTTFRDITFTPKNKMHVIANFNPVVFDTGFECTGGASYLDVLGGHYEPAAGLPVNLDSNITVNSGTFRLIIGFTRRKGVESKTYTGTSYITVNGGRVGEIRGASVENHYSNNTVITVNGGTVSSIYTGGDVTRRISGTAKVNLNGGIISTVVFNNVIKGGELNILGAAPTTVKVTYENDTLKNDAAKAKCKFVVNYNALICKPALISQLKTYFDVLNNNSCIYVKDGATGNGMTATAPMGSFTDAYNALGVDGGRIIVMGAVSADMQAMSGSFSGLISVEGNDSSSSISFVGSSAALASDTTFKSITLKASAPFTFYGCGKNITFDAGTKTEGEMSVIGTAKDATKGDVSIKLNAGTFKNVVGVAASSASYTGNVSITVAGADCDHVTLSESAGAKITSGELNISAGSAKTVVFCANGTVSSSASKLLGGTVDSLSIKGCGEKFVLNLSGITLKSNVTAEGLSENNASRVLYTSAETDTSKIADIKKFFSETKESNFIYVADGANGSGRSPDSPLSSIKTAIAQLGGDGTIVICGEYTISSNVKLDAHSYKVVITSVGPDKDYRAEGAKITLGANLFLGGETTIENVNLNVPKSVAIYAMGKKLTIGDNVASTLTNANTSYVNIYGGRNDDTHEPKSDLTINSGDWGILRVGATSTTLFQSDVELNLTVNGGTFHKYVALASRGSVSGKINFTANGGKFLQSVYAVYEEDGKMYSARYDVTITINGGEFHQEIAPARTTKTTVNGSYTVYINGGDFAHLTDLLGTKDFAGNMTSTLEIASNVDINAKEIGDASFTNPLRKNADPFMFYYDGFYYYTYTHGSSISLIKVANPADLATAEPKLICDPVEGVNMWSPEIHYFSAEEIGAEHAGWYMFFGYDDGTTANQRAHVVKCLDGDNLLGRWGNPITGKVNVPQKIEFPDDPTYNNEGLCGGVSKIVINGKAYVTYVTEQGRGGEGFHQSINITAIENPWTFVGKSTIICVPEYDWEKGGAGHSATENKWWPEVVEGASAVYADSGEVFLMYTGSGYWTKYYCLSYLSFLGGDPLDANNWKKFGEPILSYSSEVNGCGHGSYFKDHAGRYWVCYHGYLGADTQSGRYSHLERIYVEADGITIGTGKGNPAPIDTVYTLNVNPLPLSYKISGFDTMNITLPEKDNVSTDTTTPDDTTAQDTTTDKKKASLDPIAIVAIAVMAVVVVAAVVVLLSTSKKKPAKKADSTSDTSDKENTSEEAEDKSDNEAK